MKKEFFIIAIFLLISNVAVSQWPAEGGLGGSSGSSGMMRRPMPMPNANPRAIPPFLKGDQTLAETWSSTIAAYGNNPDGMTINCFAEDSDNLYIGGDFRDFDTVAGTGDIVQYNKKTGLWNAMASGLNNHIYALADHNGLVYAGGDFNGVNNSDTIVNDIAVWDGSAWHSLGSGMNGEVDALAFVGDTLYAGGYFTTAGGSPAYYLAYWDGQNWHEAAGGASADVLTLLATNDTLFVGGNFNYVNGQSSKTGIGVFGTAMLQGGQWAPLGTGYHANCFALFEGNLWAGGEYYLSDGSTLANEIASWNGSTWLVYSADTLVGTNATGDVDQLLVAGDTLLALGNFSSVAGVDANGIAMYHGGIWSQLAGGLYGYGLAAITFDGKIYVGGRFTEAGSVNAMGIASLLNGNWTSLARLGYQYVGWQSDEVTAIATTNQYIFIGGNFETIAGKTCNHVAAWDKQAQSWTTLGPGLDGDVRSLAVKGDTLIVGGTFNHAGTLTARHIAIYDFTAKTWYAMGGGAYRYVSGLAVNGDSIYAPISYSYNGSSAFDYLGQWVGSNWNSYGNGLNVGYIDALAWQGSTLYAGGSFSESDDGTVVRGIAEIQSGGSWSSLGTGLNSTVFALAPSGDSLYVGGEFTEVDGQIDSSLAVWNNATLEWNPIGASGFNGPVNALAADGKGGVYAGGQFGEVAQVSRGNLVQWNGSSFVTVGSGVDNEVEALATDESALYAGGWFQSADNGTVRSLHFGALAGAGASIVTPSLPDVASLSIYPNPASSSATISMSLAKAGNIRIEIFNALGTRVALLADGNYQSGQQEFTFDAAKLPSGIYFVRLTNDGVVTSENFIVEQEE